jgi:integrase
MVDLVKVLRPGIPQEDGTTKWRASTHGFRSTFRDWADNETEVDREVIEFALAHGIKDESEAAYRRERALEKRRNSTERWSQYCGHTATVAPLRVVA